MIKVNSALVLYFIAFVLYIIAVILGSDNLELFSKPIIIPAIYYYYYISVRGKIDYLFSLSFLLYFIGEIILLIDKSRFFYVGFLFFLLPYIIISFFLVQDLRYYIKNKKIVINNISFYIILLLFIYIFYNMIMLLFGEGNEKIIIYFLFGIFLFIMGIAAGIMQINYTNKTILFSSLMVASFILSDLFYVFINKVPDLIVLKVLYHTLQELTFYFYATYFISRTKFKLYGKRDVQNG